MSSCTDMKQKLTDYAAGILSASETDNVTAHVKTCENCRRELDLIRHIMSDAESLRQEADAEMELVHWGAVQTRLSVSLRPTRFRWLRTAVSTALALCLVIPVTWVLMHAVPTDRDRKIQVSAETVNRMEVELARGEVIRYLKKSRLLLSDFMLQCNADTPQMRWQPSPAVRDLLAENRYFSNELEAYRLKNAQTLCRQLDMVFAEMASVDHREPCRDVTRLQEMVKQEDLLLKIRLVEQELEMSEG